MTRIGARLLIENRMVGRAEIGEQPELLWKHPALERLHALRVEWYIAALIAFDIVLALYAMWRA